MSIDHSLKHAREDERSRLARELRQSVRMKEAGERTANARWRRNVQALSSTDGRPSLDFDGCTD